MIAALTGFMASGKTTFGRAAAERLGWCFIDLDEAIVRQYGTPSAIFDTRGEAFFRSVETQLLEEVLHAERDTVLALGGGTIMQENNLLKIKQSATLIWLDTAFDIILSEIENSDRPILRGKPAGEIRALYDARRPRYAAAADRVFPITSHDYPQVAADLADFIANL